MQGGPGTGKTAVALHRAAYLLYTHRDLLARTGVLVVGPNSVFLRYIEQVLPSLGETGVVLATLETLVPGITVTAEDSPEAARIKADAQMADAVAEAVSAFERVPSAPMTIPFDEHELVLTPGDIAQARSRTRRSGRRHNRGRYAFAKQLLRVLVGQVVEIDPELAGKRWVVQSLMRSDEFRDVVNTLWPLVSPVELVEHIYAEATGPLHREPGSGWTAADVPLLDEAWALVGDPNEMLEMAQQRRKQREDIEYAREVIAATGASQTSRVDAATLAARYNAGGEAQTLADRAGRDVAWHYGHVIVDEAQELSPMEWRMLVRRCPSRSMTVVGDIAQTSASWGASSWRSVLEPVAPGRWRQEELTVNYRTPSEVMELASHVLHAIDPALEPPTSVRDSGTQPVAARSDAAGLPLAVAAAAADAQAAAEGGTVGVLAPPALYDDVLAAVRDKLPDSTAGEPLEAQVSVLSVTAAKGLEFDQVVLVEPALLVSPSGDGLRDLYVAMTRPTQQLTIVHALDLPPVLADALGGF